MYLLSEFLFIKNPLLLMISVISSFNTLGLITCTFYHNKVWSFWVPLLSTHIIKPELRYRFQQ